MATKLVKILALAALVTATSSMAQEGGGVSGGGVSGGGISGISGISGGLGIDFAASNVPGANTEKTGGLAKSLDAAFDGESNKSTTDCGKLKCDE